jgi:acetyltransferase
MRAHSEGDAQRVELGGDRFVLRPIRPEDRRAYADFIARLGAEDLRRRFFDPSGLSPESEFERYVLTDHAGGAGFVAVCEASGSAEEIVGESRVYRYPGSSAAELAIIVRSDMQHRGLGHALMQKAIDYCTARGLEMIARILPDNDAMIRLAERSGMHVEHGPGGNLAIAHLGAGS